MWFRSAVPTSPEPRVRAAVCAPKFVKSTHRLAADLHAVLGEARLDRTSLERMRRYEQSHLSRGPVLAAISDLL